MRCILIKDTVSVRYVLFTDSVSVNKLFPIGREFKSDQWLQRYLISYILKSSAKVGHLHLKSLV